MRQRDIPKVFRVPRPMAQPGRRQHPFWDVVPLEVLAVLLGCLATLVVPWTRADRTVTATLLRVAASSEPPSGVVAITLSGAELRAPNCRARVSEVLDRAGARLALVVPPAGELCGGAEADGPTGPTAPTAHGSRFWNELVPELLRSDASGRVLGFESQGRAQGLAERLGVAGAEWVAARPAQSVPSLRFDALASGRVPATVIAHRVAVVGIDDLSWQGSGLGRASTLQQIGGGLGAALDDGPRRTAPRWSALLAVIALGSMLAFAHLRRGLPAALGVLVGAPLLLLAGNAIHAVLGGAWVLPGVSIGAGLAVCCATLLLPRAVAARRALVRATELMERAALIRTQSVHTIPEAEFWVRAASLAGQAHPCDGVLIAELPPHRWHLRFWPNGSMGENMVAERRRDIRRAPYCDDQGVPAIRLAHSFLAMKGVPALVVPLMAFGDVEGYVFLCGASAERAYVDQPELAERLGHDLGMLLRRRRLGSLREDDWRRTAGSLVRRPERHTATLIEGARVALDDLRLFDAALREAPVGLLFADAFADVRLVGREFARWLGALGINLPPGSAEGPLPAGQLGLARILSAATSDPTFSVARISRTHKPAVCRFRVPGEGGIEHTLELSVRTLLGESEGTKSVVGYVASLLEVEDRAQLAKSSPAPGGALVSGPLDPSGSPGNGLAVLQVVELLTSAAFTATRTTGRPVRVEPLRFSANAIGHGPALRRALEEFLVDAAERCPAGRGPVLAVQERRHHLQVDIMDLALGLPEAAFKRAVKAPAAAPPEGLEAFARLVSAVDDSHGSVIVQGGEGWGVQVSLRLLRAKTPIEAPAQEPTTSVVELSNYARKAGS